MKRALAAFVFTFLVWLAVTWTWDPISILIGVVASALIAAMVRNLELEDAPLLLMPNRLLWALAYLPVLLVQILRANLDVAYRVLHPALPIRPGIVRVETSLTSTAGRVLLANSITLTPGTLAVDLVGNAIYIHCINVPKEDPEQKVRLSLTLFEGMIRRILE